MDFCSALCSFSFDIQMTVQFFAVSCLLDVCYVIPSKRDNCWLFIWAPYFWGWGWILGNWSLTEKHHGVSEGSLRSRTGNGTSLLFPLSLNFFISANDLLDQRNQIRKAKSSVNGCWMVKFLDFIFLMLIFIRTFHFSKTVYIIMQFKMFKLKLEISFWKTKKSI